MRYLWLALTMITPICFGYMSLAMQQNSMKIIFLCVGTFAFIVALGITIAEFVKHRNVERHEENRKLLQERDLDIIKWRKEFYAESSDLYDAQKLILTKAQELGEHHADYKRSMARNIDRPFSKTTNSAESAIS